MQTEGKASNTENANAAQQVSDCIFWGRLFLRTVGADPTRDESRRGADGGGEDGGPRYRHAFRGNNPRLSRLAVACREGRPPQNACAVNFVVVTALLRMQNARCA